MKIGIDCRLWDETGIGRYIRNLVLNLRKIDRKNYYTLFVLSKNKEEILKQVRNDNFRIVIADIKWHTLEEQLKFPGILNRENLDLVHFPYFSIPIFYNRPFVITIHDLIVNHFSTGHASTLPGPIYNLKLSAYKFILNLAARKAEKIIAVSKATKDEIVDHFKINSQKIAVTYEAADDKISANKSQKVNIDGKYFLYVGNAFPHKNLDRLLEAFRAFNVDVNLVLVGKNNYFYNRLRNKAEKMNLIKKIIFLQNVSDEELANLYRNAVALVMPSLMEGFGLPALEAMTNKCLVLASDIPSLKEVCADCAVYFDPKNIKDMASKMQEAYSDWASFNNKKEKGLARVKLFSWEKMAKETLEIYLSSRTQTSGK
jgi:glycosyltransferase involved in cell wall biosynthesis